MLMLKALAKRVDVLLALRVDGRLGLKAHFDWLYPLRLGRTLNSVIGGRADRGYCSVKAVYQALPV